MRDYSPEQHVQYKEFENSFYALLLKNRILKIEDLTATLDGSSDSLIRRPLSLLGSRSGSPGRRFVDRVERRPLGARCGQAIVEPAGQRPEGTDLEVMVISSKLLIKLMLQTEFKPAIYGLEVQRFILTKIYHLNRKQNGNIVRKTKHWPSGALMSDFSIRP